LEDRAHGEERLRTYDVVIVSIKASEGNGDLGDGVETDLGRN